MLVESSVMEQRYHAVMEVVSGAPVTEVARRYGVSRQAVHGWLGRYERLERDLPGWLEVTWELAA
jgi:transposase